MATLGRICVKRKRNVEWSGVLGIKQASKQAKIARTSHGFRCCRVAVLDVDANINLISGFRRYSVSFLAWLSVSYEYEYEYE